MKVFKILIALTLLSGLLKQAVAQTPAQSPVQSLAQKAGGCEQSFSKTVTPKGIKDLSRLITQGALLSRGQELEFLFHIVKTFSNNLKVGGLKRVLDNIEKYPPGSLNKIPLPQQEITFNLKQKARPESLDLFLKSFRSKARKAKELYQISANWGVWAKLLSFESQGFSKQQRREAFFEYLDSSPLGQNLGEFIKTYDLSNNISTTKTVKDFIENPLSPYRQKTIILYKVLESFLDRAIKQKQKDVAEKLSITMAEIIYFTGFNNPLWIEKLKSKDPLVVMDAVRQILSEKDLLALSLGFTNTHYEGLKNSLLDAFPSPQVKSVEKELSIIKDQVAGILKELENQPVLASFSETFTLRTLSLQESPFRGCLGKDCSTETYFEKALDPAYLYFTLTDKDFISYGHITVVLGTAQNQKGETVKTAFVDKIQNIPNHRIIPMLEGIRLNLTEPGYRLVLPKDVGDHNGLSNSDLIRDFVKRKILKLLKNSFYSFKPQQTILSSVDDGLSRVGLDLSLLEYKTPQTNSDFIIKTQEIFPQKIIDLNWTIKDWFLNTVKSKNKEDQLLLIASLMELVNFDFLSQNQALEYLTLKIKDKDLNFELRKKSLFSFIEIQFLNWRYKYRKAEDQLQKLQLVESLFLEFSHKELKILIGEMSNWKHTNTGYRKDFTVILSKVFQSKFLLKNLDIYNSYLFKFVADLNFKDKDTDRRTALHHVVKTGKQDMVKFLLDRGANPNIKDSFKNTALHIAILWINKEIISLLLDRGAKIDTQDHTGRTGLHYAISLKHKDIVKLLLQRGADPNLKDHNGRTALYYAVWEADKDMIKLLLNNRANPNLKDKDGETLLHFLISDKNTDLIKLLLEAGADPNLKDKYHQTALHRAINVGDLNIIELLKSYGVK